MKAEIMAGSMLFGVSLLQAAGASAVPADRDEPPAKAFSLASAARSLDAAALSWKNDHQCSQCHANLLYLMARPALEGVIPAPRDTRDLYEWLVRDKWPADGLRYPAEAMVVAVPLAFNDAQTTGKLHPLTRGALDRMLSLQRPDGSWSWVIGAPKSFVREFELAMFAAIGIAIAPEGYGQTAPARKALDGLRAWTKKHPPVTAHSRGMLIWASKFVAGLATESQRRDAAGELLGLQGDDGGWAVESLAVGCKSMEDATFTRDRPSDGYGTGFVIFQARNAGVAANDPRLQRGLSWLKANQRASGRWFTKSLNKRPNHVLSNSGTAYAVLALQACGEIPPPSERGGSR